MEGEVTGMHWRKDFQMVPRHPSPAQSTSERARSCSVPCIGIGGLVTAVDQYGVAGPPSAGPPSTILKVAAAIGSHSGSVFKRKMTVQGSFEQATTTYGEHN